MPTTTGKLYLGSTLLCGGAGGYQRPSDWIAMPTITATDEKVAALFLVGDHDSNFVAFRCSGDYTVDWGDGTTENVADNTTAEHNYVFTDLSASTEFGPVGSKSRQAMIVITPQSGQNLTAISFNYRHSAISSTYTTPILEITLSAPNCTSLLISGGIGYLRLLEQCTILSHNTTTMSNMFAHCSSLQSVPLFDTSSVTNMQAMFFNCNSLQSVPLFDTSSVTNMLNMFFNCNSLQSVPLFDTSSVTAMTSMFYGCFSLQSVPLFDTSSVTGMANMFQSCYALQSVPLFDTSSVTAMQGMFQSCNSLQSVPLFDTSSVTNMQAMFYGCNSLQSVPLFDTLSVTNMANMFYGCFSLQSVPLFNASSVTSMGNFAAYANGLKRCQATGIKVSTSFLNCTLGPDELNEIYTNLADLTGLPIQTITVTGNYGTATDNPSIAIAKNWIVVG